MYVPTTYSVALALMVLTMFCWGSWANTMKIVPNWPFQLFYWDYVIGVLLVTILAGLTFGSNHGPNSFLANLHAAGSTELAYAIAGGVVFNIANLLLVAAISMTGLAVAFPIGIGLALIVGVILNYILAPAGNPMLLAVGVALVTLAIIVDALAYKRRGEQRAENAGRGIRLAIFCGLLMGSFFPLVTRASTGPAGLGPYAVAFVFAVGVLICALPVNFYLMRRPITADAPTSMAQYAAGGMTEHLSGVAGGAIWGLGAVCSFVAAHAAIVGPAISYAIGQGATMISAAWGVFIWKEFADAPPGSRRLIAPMFILFLLGLGVVAAAPLYV